jgi:hypothetical protein
LLKLSGRCDARLKRILYRRTAIADLRGQTEKLRLSSDGVHVAFGLEKGAASLFGSILMRER